MGETETTKETGGGTLGKLAERGEGVLRRLADELDRNARTREALEKLVEARGRLEQVERSVLLRLNLAPADEVERLRKRVDELERRLAVAEEATARHGAAPEDPSV